MPYVYVARKLIGASIITVIREKKNRQSLDEWNCVYFLIIIIHFGVYIKNNYLVFGSGVSDVFRIQNINSSKPQSAFFH